MWKWASLYPESTGLDLAEIPVTKAALPDYGSIQILFFCLGHLQVPVLFPQATPQAKTIAFSSSSELQG